MRANNTALAQPAISLAEAARLLGVHRNTVTAYCKSGRLTGLALDRPDRNSHVTRESLDRVRREREEGQRAVAAQGLLTLHQLARTTGVGMKAIEHDIKRGYLTTHRVRGRHYVHPAQVEEYRRRRVPRPNADGVVWVNGRPCVSTSEAARRLGVVRQRVAQYIECGALQALSLPGASDNALRGRRRYVPLVDLDTLVHARSSGVRPADVASALAGVKVGDKTAGWTGDVGDAKPDWGVKPDWEAEPADQEAGLASKS